MSQFEFVSVAVALLYSVAVGRLLMGIPEVFEGERRYWVHAGWVVYLLLFSTLSWWNFFLFSDSFRFRPISFLVTLSIPALVIVRAQLLLGRPSDTIRSYRDHFYKKRVQFFSVGLASMTLLLLVPWIAGRAAVGELTSFHLFNAPFLLVWAVGIISSRPVIHACLISAMLPIATALFLVDANSAWLSR